MFSLAERSLFTFLLITVIGSITALFLVNKTETAINEVESLQSQPLFVARREYLGTDTDRPVNWKTYRNDIYGFEMRYPDDFKEQKIGGEFSASQSVVFREIFVNTIPATTSFKEYLDALARVRAKGIREERIVVFQKETIEIAGRQAFREEVFDTSLNSFVVRTFIDLTPRAIISVSVREQGSNSGASSAPEALRNLGVGIADTIRIGF